MSENRFDRRAVLKGVLTALPVAMLARQATAADAQLPHMEETESLAKAMGYVHDSSKIDTNQVPQYKAGSHCANCIQLQGKEGDQWRPCKLFPGKLVNANGWCKVWVAKG